MGAAGAAGAVIGIGGAIASGIVAKQAADKAARAQMQAIHRQEKILNQYLTPDVLNLLAQRLDKERVESRLALQKEVDPEIAALREFSKTRLLELSKQAPETLQSNQVARQLFEENIKPNAQMEKLKSTILDRAQEDFNAGATLPPEFQAELVRSGLNTGGQAGIGVSAPSVGGVTSRLLGSAGLQLKAQRTAEGVNLAGTADALARSRQQLLANIFPTVAAKEAAEVQRATQGLQIGEQLLPESGLSGRNAVDIEIARRKQQMDLYANRGNVSAGHATSVGQITSNTIGQATAALAGGLTGGGVPPPPSPPVSAGLQGAIAGQLGGSTYGQMQQNILG